MKVKCENEVAQSSLTLGDPVDCSPPGSFIHGTCQARVLEWGAIAFPVETDGQSSNPSVATYVITVTPLYLFVPQCSHL